MTLLSEFGGCVDVKSCMQLQPFESAYVFTDENILPDNFRLICALMKDYLYVKVFRGFGCCGLFGVVV